MAWPTMILTYTIIWWVVIFAVLPWGAKPPEETEIGHASSAPEKPMLWRKILATTIISAVIFAGVYWLVESDLISFKPGPDY